MASDLSLNLSNVHQDPNYTSCFWERAIKTCIGKTVKQFAEFLHHKFGLKDLIQADIDAHRSFKLIDLKKKYAENTEPLNIRSNTIAESILKTEPLKSNVDEKEIDSSKPDLKESNTEPDLEKQPEEEAPLSKPAVEQPEVEIRLEADVGLTNSPIAFKPDPKQLPQPLKSQQDIERMQEQEPPENDFSPLSSGDLFIPLGEHPSDEEFHIDREDSPGTNPTSETDVSTPNSNDTIEMKEESPEGSSGEEFLNLSSDEEQDGEFSPIRSTSPTKFSEQTRESSPIRTISPTKLSEEEPVSFTFKKSKFTQSTLPIDLYPSDLSDRASNPIKGLTLDSVKIFATLLQEHFTDKTDFILKTEVPSKLEVGPSFNTSYYHIQVKPGVEEQSFIEQSEDEDTIIEISIGGEKFNYKISYKGYN